MAAIPTVPAQNAIAAQRRAATAAARAAAAKRTLRTVKERLKAARKAFKKAKRAAKQARKKADAARKIVAPSPAAKSRANRRVKRAGAPPAGRKSRPAKARLSAAGVARAVLERLAVDAPAARPPLRPRVRPILDSSSGRRRSGDPEADDQDPKEQDHQHDQELSDDPNAERAPQP